MKVLFCHDHRFVIAPDGRVMSRGQFSEKIISRYESIFENIWIAGRVSNDTENLDYGRLNVVFKDSSRFVPIANQSNLKSLLLGNRISRKQLEVVIRDADAVIVRLPSEIGLLAISIAVRMNKPYITEVVGCIWDSLRSHGELQASIYAPLAYLRMRRAVAKSEWTLYVSERFLQNRYPSRGKSVAVSNVNLAAASKTNLRTPGEVLGISDVILPPINVDIITSRLARMADRPLVIGMIAAMFNNQKRVDITIRALAAAVSHGADLRLEVVGPGDTSGLQALAAESGISDRVCFVGPLPHGERLFAWLDTIDVYVQASFQEGLPRALIEAMSRALPALGSDVGGTNELLPSDCLHRPGDVATLTRQLTAMLDPKRRAQHAEQNFSRAGDFAADTLDTRRKAFWRRFRESNSLS